MDEGRGMLQSCKSILTRRLPHRHIVHLRSFKHTLSSLASAPEHHKFLGNKNFLGHVKIFGSLVDETRGGVCDLEKSVSRTQPSICGCGGVGNDPLDDDVVEVGVDPAHHCHPEQLRALEDGDPTLPAR